jgi:hypothetical protein
MIANTNNKNTIKPHKLNIAKYDDVNSSAE